MMSPVRIFASASAIVLLTLVACTAPMGPQGEPGPQGPPGNGVNPVDGGCAGNRMLCGSTCVDLATDSTNCGACGVTCSDTCVMGACCGDGKVNGVEDCDKTVPMGTSCATAVAPGWTGSVACSSTCKFDTKGCSAPSSTWNDFTNGSNWSYFNVANVNGGARGFVGGAFDGRYVYMVPYYNGLVARYDTTGTFASGASYSVFDIAAINANARGYTHAAFDGRYVYFVPNYNGMVARYDTAQGFGASTSWSIFDISQLFPSARDYGSAVFDGRYLYLIPYTLGGLVVRYDTKGGFGFSGSWAAFDASTLNAGARNFSGGTFDGKYVYFAPSVTSIAARYDTTGQFGAMSSWQTYDLANVNPGCKGYGGAVFDGKNVYYVPYNNGAYDGLVTRYDTTAAFDAMMSWSTFDVSQVNGAAKGYLGATFDGKYIYFSPYYNGNHHGTVARYDTTAPFAAAPSWATFDTSPNGGRGYYGTIFDGRYVYFIQYYDGNQYNGVISRFDAKSPAWLTKNWNASFF